MDRALGPRIRAGPWSWASAMSLAEPSRLTASSSRLGGSASRGSAQAREFCGAVGDPVLLGAEVPRRGAPRSRAPDPTGLLEFV
jgi:hypothetical protein